MGKLTWRLVTILFLGSWWEGCQCGFFDYTDFDDPLQMIWNTKNPIQKESNAPCTGNVSNIQMEGVCKSYTECQLSGGASTGVGSCGLLSTCCVYMGSCGKKSSFKISYFRSDGASTPRMCTYQVKLHNRNICQLRLDFLQLSLEPPADDDPEEGTCRDEKFYVEGYSNIPEICGKNNGQHMYIPVDGNSGPITLRVDTMVGNLINSMWNIKITQLHCPGTSNFLYRNPIAAMARDFPLLAPQGCLQYYTDIRGSFRSFGFDTSNPSSSAYSINQSYAICFKRQSEACGVRFMVDFFEVTSEPGTDTNPSDYLYVPALESSITPGYGRISGPKTKNSNYISNTPGPLYVYFTSDLSANATTDSGFNIRYKLTSVCS